MLESNALVPPQLPVSAPGLRYEPIEPNGLRYRNWTLATTLHSVDVELDPTTLLPVRTVTTDVIFRGTYGALPVQQAWTWGAAARALAPRC